jgi:hypothetical protein
MAGSRSTASKPVATKMPRESKHRFGGRPAHCRARRHPRPRSRPEEIQQDRDSCEFSGISHRDSIWTIPLNSRPRMARRDNRSRSDGEEEWKPIASTASEA